MSSRGMETPQNGKSYINIASRPHRETPRSLIPHNIMSHGYSGYLFGKY